MTARSSMPVRTAACLLIASCAASSLGAAATPQDVTALFADALHCRTGFPDARQPAMADRLRRSGVVVLDRAPGENLDLLYLFPQALQIDGTEVSSVAVRGGSGSIVVARATGDLPSLARRMQAHPRAAREWQLDGFGELSARYTRVMPVRPGLDETAPRLVLGRAAGDAPDALRWGCRSYDD